MSLRFPLDNYTISQGFGANAAYYKQFGQNGHNGIDLAAKLGEPVYAAEDGTIAFEGWGQNHSWMGSIAGISVIIRHSDVHTAYAHMNSTVVNKGQWVKKGQLIGFVGQTGTATGPHTHFEVLPLSPNFANGYAGRINPTPYISTVKTATADQIKQAFRDILERDPDAGDLMIYRNYTVEEMRQNLIESPAKRQLDARKAEAARLAAEQARLEAARKAEEAARQADEARKAAERKAALEAAEKAAEEARRAEEERLKAEAELARIAEEERLAKEAAEERAKQQLQTEKTATPSGVPMTTAQLKKLNAATQEVLDSNEFTPVISEQTKTVAYFATDIAVIISGLVLTVLAILGMMDAVVAITINSAIATAMLGLKQTFRLSAKKQ